MSAHQNIVQFPVQPAPEPAEAKRGPQVEDGYTRIAHPIMDALCCADFNAREFRVVHFVIRETYGWQVKQKRMSGDYIASKVKLDPSRCSKVINELIRRGVIIRHGGSRSPVSLNKHVEEWQARVGSKRQRPTKCAESALNGPSQSAQVEPTYKDRKDITPLTTFEGESEKDSPSKSKRKVWGEPIDHELASWMAEVIDQLPGGAEKRNLESWANTLRLMRERDERDPEHIKRLFAWASQNDFWQANVLSPAKLRKQWKTLAIQFNRDSTGARHADRQATSQQRAERDRVAARLANPNDDDWLDGFWSEEGYDSAAGQPGVHPTGGDLSENVENVIHHGRHGDTGEAGSCVIDGEVADATDDGSAGCVDRADQGRGERLAAINRQAGEGDEAPTGGFRNA